MVAPDNRQETLASRKDRRDYGLVLGELLTRSCTSRSEKRRYQIVEDDETTALLGDRRSRQSRKKNPGKRPSWKQILSRQSLLVLLAYGMMSMHTMAFDSVLPVFLHTPVQRLHDNPDVRLPFKFSGGFGVGMSLSLFQTPQPHC